MKIKRLIIRNIASIEAGDIDFENSLVDRETGRPSSLFLITGDTGSGKSAILDCISMTLYGTTPRLKGVNAPRSNKFRTGNGEEISVNNIAQYTRIGISAKDDCYCELHFRGNDDIDYVSRHSLGINNRKNLRKPAWKLTIGDTEVIDDRKDEIRERIQKAVGLSFEQFSRMAMLAQGQFAEFLTGDKEVREKILEQLTATDIFSRYGSAIANIYKQTKQEKEISEKIYEEFNKKILSDDIRKELNSELDEKDALSCKVQSEVEKLRSRITYTEALMAAENEIAKLKIAQESLKNAEESPEFRKNNTIITLWDETAHQRELLSDKLKTADGIAEDKMTMNALKSEFLSLRADLYERKEKAEAEKAELEKEHRWIESREPFRKTFSEAKVTIVKIESLSTIGKEIISKEKESKDSLAAIDRLLMEISLQESDVKAKSDACTQCQDSLNKKSTERTALNPESLRNESTRILRRLHSLKDLASLLSKDESEKGDLKQAEKETEATANQHEELKAMTDKAIAESARLEKEMKDAEDRYFTMHLSLGKNFMELRKKLSEEHASNCPLCGQSIIGLLEEWNSDSYFSGILSPLEEEKKRLSDAYEIARKETDELMKKANKLDGSLKEKLKDLKQRKASVEKGEGEIKKLLKTLEIEETENLAASIQDEISKANTDYERITESLSIADRIQKEVDTLMKEKQILDKSLREAESRLQKSNKQISVKRETDRIAKERIKELKDETQILKNEISGRLKGYADDWEKYASETASRLMKEAEEFDGRTARFAKEEDAHRTLRKVLDSLDEMCIGLWKQFELTTADDSTPDTKRLTNIRIDALQKKWNEFLIKVSTLTNRISENETKIKNIDKELDNFYSEKGKSETTLRQLLEASEEINEVRTLLQKHRDEVSNVTILLTEASKKREQSLKTLNIEDSSAIEDIEQLKLTLSNLVKQKDELTLRLGAIKERLEIDEKTRTDSERQRVDLESKTLRFRKWDKMNHYFGGTKFRTLVQSHILRPLLDNANLYLRRITDHYTLTCSDENEQLSILVLDRYHNNEPRSATVLSGGERFMISLALSLALSAMNRPDLNVDILFIDEGFGTLDARSLEMVMSTLRRLPEINGQTGRRVGVISHREELSEQIDCQIQLQRAGEGRSRIVIK